MSYNLILWIKVVHICFVVFWMAGMLYLPRLFVYHAQIKPNSEAYDIFLVMERKLIRIIMNPSMVVVFITGLLLFIAFGGFKGPIFLHLKLFFALIMAAMHGYFVGCYRKFLARRNEKSHKFFRLVNEIPGVIFVIMVIIVVMKNL